MRKIVLSLILFFLSGLLYGQTSAFRFIHISDTHIGAPNGSAGEDLRHTVRDINQMEGIAFVVITGDITELGTNDQINLAKQILDSLKVNYYILPGNHDTGWSESGGQTFINVFGYDKFQFEYNGILFLGCASGPYVRMSDGHIPRDAIVWLDKVLAKTSHQQPIIFFNHYPLNNSLDNWYELADRLNKYNTIAYICGHGHANKQFNFESVPGIMGRSNLRAKAAVGGYNIVDVRKDSIIYSTRKPGIETLKPWAEIENINGRKHPVQKYERPDYDINKKYEGVKSKWMFSSDANVISTPALGERLVIFGNQNGKVEAIDFNSGKSKWAFHTKGAIFSSPAISNRSVVFGSADGFIYCLNVSNGKKQWQVKTDAAVLGSPVIIDDTIFIGGSDHSFRALDIHNGKILWQFTGLDGPVVSTPLVYDNMVVFGAWDKNLYALNKNDGSFAWKWNNGSPVINYSPAACIPVAANGVIYIVAPDRFITAIDAAGGETLWRNNDATVRESVGISADGKWIYGKTMQDSIVAYAAGREKQNAAWKMNCGFGYEHVPSMLIENDGLVFFGTKNGVVYCIDPENQRTVWAHKIDNSMVNTVNVLNRKQVVASTMDGKVALLQVE